jgi:hypothetical protein
MPIVEESFGSLHAFPDQAVVRKGVDDDTLLGAAGHRLRSMRRNSMRSTCAGPSGSSRQSLGGCKGDIGQA